MTFLAARKCRRRGHDWFPGMGSSEFLPRGDACLRCKATRVILPWGDCLNGHALADHYDDQGRLRSVAGCGGPR